MEEYNNNNMHSCKAHNFSNHRCQL